MKKLLLLSLGVCIAMMSLKLKDLRKASVKPKTSTSAKAATQTPVLMTLNGFKYAEAAIMVEGFLPLSNAHTYRYTRAGRTNIWFSKAHLKSIAELLNREKANGVNTDGIRLYFAKDATSFNIVMVSTKDDGISAITHKTIHQDYFDHNNIAFLNTAITHGENLVDHGTSARGATLYRDLYSGTLNCPTTGPCTPDPNNHYLDCDKARSWVEDYQATSNSSKYVTSEWFELDLINTLNSKIQNPANGEDGLRIYYSHKSDGSHGFILATTKADAADANRHYDDYRCLAITPVEQNLQNRMRNKWLQKQNKIAPKNQKQLQLFQKNQKQQQLYSKNVFTNSKVLWDTDDNGEQCPDNCEGTTWHN